MNKTKIFAELGYGNAIFFNTEIEKANYVHRLAKFIIPTLLHDLIKLYFFSFKNP